MYSKKNVLFPGIAMKISVGLRMESHLQTHNLESQLLFKKDMNKQKMRTITYKWTTDP